MKRRARNAHRIPIVAAVFLLFSLCRSAGAVVTCTSGCSNPSSPLTDDYVCPTTGGYCITLSNGADLDLNGHTITASNSGPTNAIRCSARGSVITDTAATKGKITGSNGGFYAAIENCEEVDGVVFDEMVSVGVKNTFSSLPLRRAVNNNFDSSAVPRGLAIGIQAHAPTRDAEISGNTCIATNGCVNIHGTSAAPGPLVTNNTIDDYVLGIEKTGTGNVRFVTNTLTNRDTSAIGNDCIAGNTLTGSYSFKNSCDCSSDCPTPTSCTSTVTLTGSNTLTADYESNGGTVPCFQLNSGADLDLNGHTISHIGSGTGSAAIKCAAGGSLITNTGGRALIRGDWTDGTLDCEKVDNVSFGAEGNGTITTAITMGTTFGANQIANNVIDGTTNGVSIGKFLGASSYVDNNGISVTDTAISVVGTTGAGEPDVTDNVLRGYGIGIKKTGNDKVRIERNLLMGRDTGFSGGSCLDVVSTGATVDDNICDCLNVCPVEPPFTSPWF